MSKNPAIVAAARQLDAGVNRLVATIARPADTNAYVSGDLLAQSVTAGSVVPLSFSTRRKTSVGGLIKRARLRKSSANITTAAFRLHLFTVAPTVTNGDNGVLAFNTTDNYVGAMDITVDQAGVAGAAGFGVPNKGDLILVTAETIYGLIEVRSAYTPTSAETFEVVLEFIQN